LVRKIEESGGKGRKNDTNFKKQTLNTLVERGTGEAGEKGREISIRMREKERKRKKSTGSGKKKRKNSKTT